MARERTVPAASSEDRRPPGRPRSEEADRAILEATLRLMREEGYERMSLEGIAAAAGVGKATIYRRHPDKAKLAVAAMEAVGGHVTAPIDTGDTREDLVELVRRFVSVVSEAGLPMLGTLLAQRDRHPELMERFRERLILPRRRMMRSLLERGVERGDVRPDADLELAVDMLTGPYFPRAFAGGVIGRDWAGRVVAAVWEGIGARPGGR